MQEEPSLSAASIQPGEAVDRSASGLQFQKYSLGLKATGATLGIGRRTVPDPDVQFKNPPLSRAQMGGGANARLSMDDEGEL